MKSLYANVPRAVYRGANNIHLLTQGEWMGRAITENKPIISHLSNRYDLEKSIEIRSSSY